MNTRSNNRVLSRVARRKEERLSRVSTALGNFSLKVAAAVASKFLIDLLLTFF